MITKIRCVGLAGRMPNEMQFCFAWDVACKRREALMQHYRAVANLYPISTQFWPLHVRKDLLVLEMVQRRLTRLIIGMNGLM